MALTTHSSFSMKDISNENNCENKKVRNYRSWWIFNTLGRLPYLVYLATLLFVCVAICNGKIEYIYADIKYKPDNKHCSLCQSTIAFVAYNQVYSLAFIRHYLIKSQQNSVGCVTKQVMTLQISTQK